MLDEGVDERSVGVASGGVDHQPGRFVDDDQVLVLEHHGECDVLALGGGGHRRRQHDDEFFTGFDPLVGVPYRPPAATDMAVADQRLNARAADTFELTREEGVDTHSRIRIGDLVPGG